MKYCSFYVYEYMPSYSVSFSFQEELKVFNGCTKRQMDYLHVEGFSPESSRKEVVNVNKSTAVTKITDIVKLLHVCITYKL